MDLKLENWCVLSTVTFLQLKQDPFWCSCLFRVLSKYEKTISSHAAWTEALQWSVTSRRVTKCYLLFEILAKWQNSKAQSLFHTRSSLLCLVCRCVFSFHCVRTCVVWERHCLSDTATATRGGGSLRRINCDCNFVHLALKISSFAINTCHIILFSQRKVSEQDTWHMYGPVIWTVL